MGEVIFHLYEMRNYFLHLSIYYKGTKNTLKHLN